MIQILKSGWYRDDTDATWSDGDFDADGDVDTDDLDAVYEAGYFDANGIPYRVTGIAAQHSRRKLASTEQPIRLMYLPLTGSIVIDSQYELSS